MNIIILEKLRRQAYYKMWKVGHTTETEMYLKTGNECAPTL
jgi:hypothetical protein